MEVPFFHFSKVVFRAVTAFAGSVALGVGVPPHPATKVAANRMAALARTAIRFDTGMIKSLSVPMELETLQTNHFISVLGSEPPPGLEVDRGGNEANRAVAQHHVHPVRMIA